MDCGEGRVFERQKARMGQDNVTTHLCHLLHICTSAIAALLSSHLLQDLVWKRWGPHLGTSQKCLRILMLGIFISGSMELMAARTEVWVPLRPCQSTPHQLRVVLNLPSVHMRVLSPAPVGRSSRSTWCEVRWTRFLP